jgi:hypothetical protein
MNYIITSNIYDNILNRYNAFYNNLLIGTSYQSISTNILSDIDINFNNTKTIFNNIKTDKATYLAISSNNSNYSSNINNLIITYDRTTPVSLVLYNTDTIINGITDIYNIALSNIDLYTNYKNIKLLDIYDYLLDGNLLLNTAYNNYNNLSNTLLDILNEIVNDINILNNFASISNYNKYEFTDMIYNITNKYIFFINKTYEYANIWYLLTNTIYNLIDNNISNSISLIKLLNDSVKNTNDTLLSAWNVSLNITDFYNIIYSMNALIKEEELNIQQNNVNTNNTDVIIVGNLVKLYPKNTLIVGYNSLSSRWADSINDANKYSPFYTFNDTFDNSVGSLNCKGKTFMNISTPTILSLKTSTTLDINLINTAERTNMNDAIIDNVKFKLSHITNRSSTNDEESSYIQNTLFEIIPNSKSPFFSCFNTSANTNIINIGSGIFYDNNNYKCIIEDTVLHLNDNTPNYLLKLTNNSTNSVKIGIKHNNFNNWDLIINNNFNFNYNDSNLLNINSNNIITNISLNINSTSNNPSIVLKNQYSNIGDLIITCNFDITKDFKINYDNTGVKYTLLNTIQDYEVQNILLNINSNVVATNITYNFMNINANYMDIDTELNNFKFDNSTMPYTYNLLPPILTYDSNITCINNNYEIKNVEYDLTPHFPVILNNISSIVLRYIVPSSINNLFTSRIDYVAGINVHILTKIAEFSRDASDYGSNLLTFEYNSINFSNLIVYNKYSQFPINQVNVILNKYEYNITRHDNIIPISIYNTYSNIINVNVENNQNNTPVIEINNRFKFLKTSLTDYTITTNTYIDYIEKRYELMLFGLKKYLPINIITFDIYDNYSSNTSLIPINTPINMIKISDKIPIIKQQNIYNRYHNIYSYTNDYELYLDDFKLLNVDETGTLKTTGNIQTNNIYLNGDIYNGKGVSLYDNVLSIIENVSSNVDFKLSTKNVILNPSVYNRNNYKGGVIINGDNVDSVNNNLFQINNFPDNDNFITLNSCTSKSFIHFNNKITKNAGGINLDYNSIYRIGLTNETFGIWKNNLNEYDKNLFIDTNITTNYINALEINKNISDNKFILNFNGTISSTSDQRLKNDIRVIDNALNKLCTLRGITYENIGSIAPVKRQTGLLAQEVNEVLPEAVSINNDGYYNIAYGNLAGLIVESIKELREEIRLIKVNLNLN